MYQGLHIPVISNSAIALEQDILCIHKVFSSVFIWGMTEQLHPHCWPLTIFTSLACMHNCIKEKIYGIQCLNHGKPC